MLRKEAERETRQQFIIDAAKCLYSEKGIENTSMEDIADAAEYTRRTLYSYFANKDEICLMALIEDMQIRWQKQKEAVSQVGTGLEKLKAWAESLYRYVKREPHSIRLQFYWDYIGVNPELFSAEVFDRFKVINTELADGLIDIFNLGNKDGSIRSDCNNNMTISQFLGSFRGILNRAITPTYSFIKTDPDEYIAHFLTLFCRGIGNTEGK